MNTQEIIKIQNNIFSELKNLWEKSSKGEKYNLILDNFLDELEIKKNKETRFIAYSRISELRVEPLELYLEDMAIKIEENNKKLNLKLPNKLENKQKILEKAYNYVARIYEDLFEQFIYELENTCRDVSLKHLNIINDLNLEIFKGTLKVGKAFNKFMPVWQKAIKIQNDILDKKFDNNSEKIMNYLKEKKLLDKGDRYYSVIIAGKSRSYFEAFPKEVGEIIFSLEDFIEKIKNSPSFSIKGKGLGDGLFYINYLSALKNAFSEKDTNQLLEKWQKVDEAWMEIKGDIQISHPLEFYEDKYRKAVAPEWDLRIVDTETLDSKVVKNIEEMYEKIYTELDKQNIIPHPSGAPFNSKESISRKKYCESYNFSLENIKKAQLYISEPVMYFGSELNGMFSAQVVPNDEVISAKYGKKIFAFPKMVLEDRKKAPLMKLTKEVLDENLLKDFQKIIQNDELFYEIYDIETIGHEFGHILFNTQDNELIMNSKTGNFKNIEEFKATTGGLCSYFMSEIGQTHRSVPTENNVGVNLCVHPDFEKDLIVRHLYRCIWLLKYREVVDVLPYYNEALIHLDIMLESEIFKIIPLLDKEGLGVVLNFTEENYLNLKQNYIKHYKKLINIYLEKKDAGEFLFDYVVTDKKGNNIPQNKKLQEFVEYYYYLYKKIGNEVV